MAAIATDTIQDQAERVFGFSCDLLLEHQARFNQIELQRYRDRLVLYKRCFHGALNKREQQVFLHYLKVWMHFIVAAIKVKMT